MFNNDIVQAAMASLQSAIKGLNDYSAEPTKDVCRETTPESDDMAPSKPAKALLREVNVEDNDALQEIAETLSRSRKQLVVTGAGISTSCGIPDFRSKDGLYRMIPQQTRLPTPPLTESSTSPKRRRSALESQCSEEPSRKRIKAQSGLEELSLSQISSLSRESSFTSTSSRLKGEDLFHARVFQRATTTTMFYQFIASLRNSIKNDVKDTSETHKFLRALRDGGRLIRCYTQNIDGLEQKEALCMNLKRGRGTKARFTKKIYERTRPHSIQNTDFDGGCEVVQLHGELGNLRCRVCSMVFEWTDEDTEVFLEGAAPKCALCTEKSDQRQAKGKRGLAVGELRPNIVLYGEDHPRSTLITPLVPFDIASSPDVLIIMGTSLKVHGLQKIIRDFAKAVHCRRGGRVIFVNRTRPAESVWEGIIDDWIAMDCDDWVRDLKRRKPKLWLPQGDAKLLEKTPNSPKRKRKQTTDVEQAGHRRRKVQKFISVNVPRPLGPMKELSESGKHLPVPCLRQTAVIFVPPLTTKKHKKVKRRQKKSITSTANGCRFTTWKIDRQHNYEGRNVLSPLLQQRPKSSPLNVHFKCGQREESKQGYVPGSPLTPPFSPLRESNLTPTEVIMSDDSAITTPSPHSRVVVHPDSPTIELNCPLPEPIFEDEAVLELDVELETATPVRRQLSFVRTDLNDEKPVPLYARFGHGLRSLMTAEFRKRVS